jgi:hypothetical protein
MNNEIQTYPVEKLNLWDRIFNRYKTVLVKTFNERWVSWEKVGWYTEKIPYGRDVALYHKVDRLTGNVVKIWKDYLDD